MKEMTKLYICDRQRLQPMTSAHTGKGVAMGKLKTWTCKGCVNTEYRITPQGEIAEYCKFYKNGKTARHEWVTNEFIDCLDKQTERSE